MEAGTVPKRTSTRPSMLDLTFELMVGAMHAAVQTHGA
jgi:hypothetical protein